MDNDKVKLYEFILDHYSLGELKDLCFYLTVTYDDLEGGARKDKVRELVEYMLRRKRVDDLRAVLNQQRPSEYRAAFPVAVAVPIATPPAPAAGRDPRRIFISHAMADAAFAHRLADDLRRDGYDIWIAPESIFPGEQWVRAIGRGLEESGAMVLLLSPAAAASPWVEMETNVAIELERTKEMDFIPLLLARGRYPALWRAYQWVMGEGEYAAGLAALRARLDGGAVETFQRNVSTTGRRIHEKTGIELIRIPAGPFLYGSSDADGMARDNEKPQRMVDLPAYWIGRTPVTNAEFARFVAATGYQTTAEVGGKSRGWTGSMWDWIAGADWRHPSGPKTSIDGKDTHPVVQVSWHDAQAFCDWAGLALPAEEQWEKAARGTDGRIWPWGNEPPTTKHCNFNWNAGVTTPVGKYSPKGDSFYSCVDMAGNVAEWMKTSHKGDELHFFRGGSWYHKVRSTRAAHRIYRDPVLGNDFIGFRVVELLSDPGS